ncbi:SLC13 family permease [Escherichia coli]
MVRRFATERRLAMFMVLAAALLSTFLTNDVALFIVVPLTITLKRLCEIPVNRLIIFEALAVNAGSLLTPIGNPQNILIWMLRFFVCRIYCPNGTARAAQRR